MDINLHTGPHIRLIRSALLSTFLLLAISACSRNSDPELDKSVTVNEPDSFAAFINPIAGLPSGDYVIEANADNAGASSDFVLTVDYDDGSSEEFTGSWTSGKGTVSYNITTYKAGGIKIRLSSDIDNNLRLINSNGFVMATGGKGGSKDSVISLQRSRIDSETYGKAYYAAIDPINEKDTLEKWKVSNGYYIAEAAGKILQPRFRDTKDLGYGRGLRMWTKPDGSLYFFVENFQVRSIPGLEYTSLNLDALLLDLRQHHFGSNAIEFSTYPYGPGEPCGYDSGSTCAISDPDPPKFAKFYTFDATHGNQKATDHEHETRLNRVNLDGRGMKAMPGACVYCHGGTLKPLRSDGTFRDNSLNGSTGNGINGDVNAKLQLMEVPSFEYGDFSPYTKEDQEPIIKQANMAIYCTYPNLPAEGIQAACAQYCVDPANTANCDGNGSDILDIFNTNATPHVQGTWTGYFATEMTEGWYDDPAKPGMFDRDTFNADYVPPAWRYDSSDNMPPPDSERLFLDVVQPICFVCHSRRGTDLGSNLAANGTKDIDFSSYEKFISHAEQIKQYVFDRGVMPLSLRGYNKFWNEGGDGPELLAAHLNGILEQGNRIPFDSEGKVTQPGHALADAGPDRTSTSPVRLFGANSRFVDRFSWRITSEPDGSDAMLTDTDTARPMLTTSVDGLYEITLTAVYGSDVDIDTVKVKIDSSLTSVSSPPDPKTITFETHIKPVFGNAGGDDGKQCNECHSGAGGAIPGVPVFWLDDIDQPATGTTFYQEVLSRVDFKDPENSLILMKPSNHHHYGGLRGGFEIDNPANHQNYDLFLNWILEGAPEK